MADVDPKNFNVSTKALVFNNEGKLLLVQEEDGMWEIPGGRMEHGENFEQALKREIMEEMGVECTLLDKHPYWAWPHQRSNSGNWKIMLGFRATLNSFDFITSDECVDHAFYDKAGIEALGDMVFNKEELLSYTWPSDS